MPWAPRRPHPEYLGDGPRHAGALAPPQLPDRPAGPGWIVLNCQPRYEVHQGWASRPQHPVISRPADEHSLVGPCAWPDPALTCLAPLQLPMCSSGAPWPAAPPSPSCLRRKTCWPRTGRATSSSSAVGGGGAEQMPGMAKTAGATLLEHASAPHISSPCAACCLGFPGGAAPRPISNVQRRVRRSLSGAGPTAAWRRTFP